ncbi:MAG: divalent-cation tolerance protein CutA [Candidatus Hodarchaeales archaeon]|jgi:periplasmic divalent cation tolerance protein
MLKEIIFVYITNPDKKTAKKIANNLLEKRLIACVNLYDIESMYWWEETIVDGPEVVMIAKTTSDKFDELKNEVEASHPYSVPCVIQIPVSNSNESYKKWILDETQEKT